MLSEQNLFEVWMIYSVKNDVQYFQEFLRLFLELHSGILDKDFIQLSEGFIPEGPSLTALPDGLLQVITQQLTACLDQSLDCNIYGDLPYILDLVKLLIIVSRNLDNVALVGSCTFVNQTITITTALLKEAHDFLHDQDKMAELQMFIQYLLYFFECLYDPYFIWRQKLLERTINYHRHVEKPALLHVEAVPFIYECFQVNLDVFTIENKLRLLHVFGAIMTGSQTNALLAITPATQDLLFGILAPAYSSVKIIDPNAEDLALLQELGIKCLAKMFHVLHASSPDQRQVDTSVLVDSYLCLVQKACMNENTENSESRDVEENYDQPVQLLNVTSVILTCPDKLALQAVFVGNKCFNIFIDILHKTKLTGVTAQILAMAVIRAIAAVIAGNRNVRETFTKMSGYTKLLEALQSIGQPSMELLETVLNLIVEGDYKYAADNSMHNVGAALMLLRWLSNIRSHEMQLWLVEKLYSLSSKGIHNKTQCCCKGMIHAILCALEDQEQISRRAIEQLLKLLELLGSHSITSSELKKLLSLLRLDDNGNQFPYSSNLMHVMSVIARREGGNESALHYFDIQEIEGGITIPGIRKWPGNGFSFHAWLRLDTIQQNVGRLERRILYSFFTSAGMGFEAFITTDCMLIIAVSVKKEYHALTVSDQALADGQWHCVNVCHASSRRPFVQSQVSVFIDGRQRLTSQIKFPSLAEPFTFCQIAAGGPRNVIMDSSHEGSGTVSTAQNFSLNLAHLLKPNLAQGVGVQTTATGTENTVWGVPVSLHGQLASVCVFSDALQPTQVIQLFMSGPNTMSPFLNDDSEPTELAKKLVLYYNAKACKDGMCIDLSPSHLYGGIIHAPKCATYDIRQIIKCIGGIQVLFPILEQSRPNLNSSKSSSLPDNADKSCDNKLLTGGSSVFSDSYLEQNQVAGFLTLLRNMIQNDVLNQEMLLTLNGISVIGALMRELEASLIDVHVLMALQLLIEGVGHSNLQLQRAIYQYLLFDFRIWSRADFPVRIGHIQYISTIIKDDRKYFRKKYGVQYMLDFIQSCYSAGDASTAEDSRAIRTSLLGLVKYFVTKEITHDEVCAIMGYFAVASHEQLLTEVINVLTVLLEQSESGRGTNDQLFLLLYEQGCGELFYAVLVNKAYSTQLKYKVLKLISLLLKTEKVSEKYKTRLRLHDVGFLGLTTRMQGQEVSTDMILTMLDQLLMTYSEMGYAGALSVLQLPPVSDIDTKLEIAKKLLSTLLNKSGACKMFAKQMAWQDSITRLYISKLGTGGADNFGISLPRDESDDPLIDVEETLPRDDSDDDLIIITAHSFGTFGDKTEVVPSDDAVLVDMKYSGGDFPVPMVAAPKYLQRDSLSNTEDILEHFKARQDLLDRTSRSRSHSDSPEMCSERLSAPQKESSSSNFSLAGSSISNSASDILGQSSSYSSMTSSVMGSDIYPKNWNGLTLHFSITETTSKEECLAQFLLNILHMIMWRGKDGSDRAIWLERGQVFSCINMLGMNNELVISPLEIKRRMLEMIVQTALSELKESQQTNYKYMENGVEAVRISYDFLAANHGSEDANKCSEFLLENIMSVLDLLAVWEDVVSDEWVEMAHMGLAILLVFVENPQLEICAMATAKLHALLQTRQLKSTDEACYLLQRIDDVLCDKVDTDHVSFLIPVIKCLIEKSADILNIGNHLPSVPVALTLPSFFDSFGAYSKTAEWRSFIDNVVHPRCANFSEIKERQEAISRFWNDCYKNLMVSIHKRNREGGESKLRFQSNIEEPFIAKGREEKRRYQQTMTLLSKQHEAVLSQWKQMKHFMEGQRGAWASRHSDQPFWKLSPHENFSRMRVKLAQSFKSDEHKDASRIRDNLAVNNQESSSAKNLPIIAVAKEARVVELKEDRLGDEEWHQLSNASQSTLLQEKEKVTVAEHAELVTLVDETPGRFEVTTKYLYFYDTSNELDEEGNQNFKYPVSHLREVHLRRYNLRRSALEFFLIDQTNFFLNFSSAKIRNKVYSKILSLRPVSLSYYGSRSPAELLKASGLTEKWRTREITNFDYLMQLNTIAGRTYNDLGQYPVFPWILTDYESSELDLEDPSIYRDLSKPIGVINSRNATEVKEKYESFVDRDVPPFHYGSHYSNAAGVMYYMVRVEPFTSLHIQLQSGRFDVADRQFHSIAKTWHVAVDSLNDVKELIPEFFYLPEFLVNTNHFDLGKLQGTKEVVNHVKLPKWAKSAEDFIVKHRKALESEHVSVHLHEWIDLIFGAKQQGPGAVEALNVFYYCTYEGAVDLDAIEDPVERKALEGMIKNFGQTPCQLLKEPHPPRMTFDEALQHAAKSDSRKQSLFNFLGQLTAFFVEVSVEREPLVSIEVPKNQARSFIQHGMPDAMVTITESGVIGIHGWLPYDKAITNYFTFEKDPSLASAKTRKRIGGPFAPSMPILPSLFVTSHDAKLLFSGGHWDNSIRVYSLAKGKTTAYVIRHTDIVTCLALDSCGSKLISGSRDTTCMIWQVTQDKTGATQGIAGQPLQILYGHDAPITCVVISTELDTAVTASLDGTCIIHTVRKGQYMHTLKPFCMTDVTIPSIAIGDQGHIVVFCKAQSGADESFSLHLYSINGKHLASDIVSSHVTGMLISGGHLVTGYSSGHLSIRELFWLKHVVTMPLHAPVCCLSITPGNTHLLAGLADGKLIIISVGKKPEPKSS